MAPYVVFWNYTNIKHALHPSSTQDLRWKQEKSLSRGLFFWGARAEMKVFWGLQIWSDWCIASLFTLFSDIRNQKNEELKPAVQIKTMQWNLIGMMRDLHLFLFFPLFYRQRADSREGLRCSHDLWLLQTEPSQEAAAAAPLWTAGTRRHRVTKPICPQL